MKIAYFDTIAGISGDMTLGAFVSAGLSIDELASEITKLNLKGIELEASHVHRGGIAAVKLEVIISGKQHHHRNLNDIFSIIEESSLSDRVKADAKKIFMEVAKAEAKVHSSTVDKIHFHEVGALDSIIDIVGTAICLEKFSIEKIYSSPVKLGSGGFVESEHGKLPLPGPATLEILKGYPTILTEIPFELTTPTGASIIKAMSSGVLSTERIVTQEIGYGAGTREIPQVPNLLRLIVGTMMPLSAEDDVVIVETNIDDMNPEIYPYVIDHLLSSGAHDAYLVPIIMKKGRPGILLSVMINRSKLDDALKIIFAQTTTLGVRIHAVERKKLKREQRQRQTKLGMVQVKVVWMDGKERYVPEYEECKRLASEKNIPLLEVYKILEKELSV